MLLIENTGSGFETGSSPQYFGRRVLALRAKHQKFTYKITLIENFETIFKEPGSGTDAASGLAYNESKHWLE